MQIRTVAFGHNTLIHEWSKVYRMSDGTNKRSYAIAVIPYDESGKMTGERVYTDRFYAAAIDARRGPEFYERPDVTDL